METDQSKQFYDEVRRRADRICQMILSLEYPDVDIQIAISELRWAVEERAPERLNFFEMIYESRFDRLWEQFRAYESDELREY